MRNSRGRGRISPIVLTDMAMSGHNRPVGGVRRFAPEAFPVHVAVHEVSLRRRNNAVLYSEPHVHSDQDEVNLLISRDSLRFRISLDGRAREVTAPAAVWIPAGVRHSANAVSGEGFFICVKFREPSPVAGGGKSGRRRHPRP